ARIADFHADADAQAELQIFRERLAQPAARLEGQRRRGIQTYQDVVETVAAAEDDLELVHVAVRPYQLLDPPRVDDDAAHLLHVVQARQHTALEGDQRAAARAAAVGQLDDVTGAVAQQRHGLSIEAREHQLAALTRLHRPLLLVEDFRIDVVLVHVREARARAALEAPRGNLGQARQIVRAYTEGGLDLRLGGRDRGARLARVPRDLELRLLGQVDALLRGGLGQEQRVRRRAAEHRDRIREQRVQPLLGGEPAHRVDEAAEVLRRVEAAPVADPRPVGERGHHHVRLAHAEGVQ